MIPVSVCLLIILYHHLSHSQSVKLLHILAIAVPVVEAVRILWMICLGEGNWVKLLPLHLCGLQVIFIPLAVFTKNRRFQSYVWATSILGGIVAILYPSGIVETYPFFHFQTLQSFVLHILLVLVPLLMFLCGEYHPRTSDITMMFPVLLLGASAAFAVDWIWDQNYMFLRSADGVPLVQALFDLGGYPLYWTVLALAVLAGSRVILKLGEILDQKRQWKA